MKRDECQSGKEEKPANKNQNAKPKPKWILNELTECLDCIFFIFQTKSCQMIIVPQVVD